MEEDCIDGETETATREIFGWIKGKAKESLFTTEEEDTKVSGKTIKKKAMVYSSIKKEPPKSSTNDSFKCYYIFRLIGSNDS